MVPGEVAYANVELNADGKSKGWGIVEFESADDARKALTSTVTLDGQEIDIREAPFRPGPTSGVPGTAGPAFMAKENRVYVGNLAWQVGWRELKEHFASCGKVLRTEVFSFPDGRSRVRTPSHCDFRCVVMLLWWCLDGAVGCWECLWRCLVVSTRMDAHLCV